VPGRQRQRDVRSEAPRFFDIADCALSAIGGICRQLEPSQRCFNIIQAVCRIRVSVTVIWFRLAVEMQRREAEIGLRDRKCHRRPKRAERYRRKSPQKRPILSRPGSLRFGTTGWWARQGSNLRPPPSCVRSTQMRTLSNSWRRRTRWLIADLRYVMWDCDAATATTPPKKRKIT
jgi:hypothetical protein